jgi:hypothetical protein
LIKHQLAGTFVLPKAAEKSDNIVPAVVLSNKKAELGMADGTIRDLCVWLPSRKHKLRCDAVIASWSIQ